MPHNTGTNATITNPRVKKLVEELQQVLQDLKANPTEVVARFSGRLNASQIEKIIIYQLELIIPSDPTKPNIQQQLANLQRNADLTFKHDTHHTSQESTHSVSGMLELDDLPSTASLNYGTLTSADIDLFFAEFSTPRSSEAARANLTEAATTTLSSSSSTPTTDPATRLKMDLPRSIVFLCDSDNNLLSGVLTLSKNSEGVKPPPHLRIEGRGTIKSQKTYLLLNRTKQNISVNMARMKAILGDADPKFSEQAWYTEMQDPNCSWRHAYINLMHEVSLAQTLKHKNIAFPRIGTPYRKTIKDDKGALTTKWVVNVHDERALSLQKFIKQQRHLRKQAAPATNKEYLVLSPEQQAELDAAHKNDVIPSLYRKLAGDMLRGVKVLHDANIIHRDIKSDNMLIDRDSNGEIYLKYIDFGNAISIEKVQEQTEMFYKILGYNSKPNEDFILEPTRMQEIIEILRYKYAIIYPDLNRLCIEDLTSAQQLMRNISIDFLNNLMASQLDPTIKDSFLSDPPDIINLNARINLFLHSVAKNIPAICRVLPLASYEYAAPEILELHLNETTIYSPYFLKYEKHFNDLHRQQPMGLQYLDDARFDEIDIPTSLTPDKAQDMYSIGVCMFELFYGHLPNLQDPKDYDRIFDNELLAGLLEANPLMRFDVDDALEEWKEWEELERKAQQEAKPKTPSSKRHRHS